MAKKKSTKNEELDSMDVVREIMRKDFDAEFHTMGELKILPKISTGCLGLDTCLGGGFSRGKIYEIYGPPMGGKTTLTMSTIARAQENGLKALFVDAEHGAYPPLFTAMGIDIHKLSYVAQPTAERNIDALKVYMKDINVALAVIDSVSALVPTSEVEAETKDQFMGLQARLMSKAMRTLSPLAFDTKTTLIFINQIRYKMSPYGSPTTTTGGEALKYFTSARINVSGITKASHILDADGNRIGHKTTFTVEKNRENVPFKPIEVPLIYGQGYDTIWEVLHIAIDLGIITQNGAYYKFTDEEKNFAQGEANALQFLIDNIEIYTNLKNSIIRMVGLEEEYDKQLSQ